MNTARLLHQAHATIVTAPAISIDDALKAKAHYTHKGIPMLLQQAAALTILLCLSPVLLLIALFIKMESQGPVLFSQTRVGEFGRQFAAISCVQCMYRDRRNTRRRLPVTAIATAFARSFITIRGLRVLANICVNTRWMSYRNLSMWLKVIWR